LLISSTGIGVICIAVPPSSPFLCPKGEGDRRGGIITKESLIQINVHTHR
jgi:hypothetical protein